MTPWVSRLLFANVSIYILSEFYPQLFSGLVLIPAAMLVRPWTAVTYMFLHAGLWHLAFNMLSLFFFGPRVEERLGSRHFLGLYLMSGLGGAALSLLTPYVSIVGASGAIFGVFLAYARFWPHHRIYLWGVVPIEARILLLVTTAYAVFGGFSRFGGGIAHFAHLGGYGGAFLYMLWLGHRSPAQAFRRKVDSALYGKPSVLPGEPKLDAVRREGLHPLNIEELDRLAEKIKLQGAKSLTPDERAFLNRLGAI